MIFLLSLSVPWSYMYNLSQAVSEMANTVLATAICQGVPKDILSQRKMTLNRAVALAVAANSDTFEKCHQCNDTLLQEGILTP